MSSKKLNWLNDRIMNAAQILLRRQFPYISRFDTVLKALNLTINPFIKTVNGEDSHCLTLSTLDFRPGKKKAFSNFRLDLLGL